MTKLTNWLTWKQQNISILSSLTNTLIKTVITSYDIVIASRICRAIAYTSSLSVDLIHWACTVLGVIKEESMVAASTSGKWRVGKAPYDCRNCINIITLSTIQMAFQAGSPIQIVPINTWRTRVNSIVSTLRTVRVAEPTNWLCNPAPIIPKLRRKRINPNCLTVCSSCKLIMSGWVSITSHNAIYPCILIRQNSRILSDIQKKALRTSFA